MGNPTAAPGRIPLPTRPFERLLLRIRIGSLPERIRGYSVWKPDDKLGAIIAQSEPICERYSRRLLDFNGIRDIPLNCQGRFDIVLWFRPALLLTRRMWIVLA